MLPVIRAEPSDTPEQLLLLGGLASPRFCQ